MLIDGFNAACKNIASSYLEVGDEFMSVIRFWTTKKGNLPHLSYMFCKPEPLGKSSRQLPVMLQVTCYSLKSREGRKG